MNNNMLYRVEIENNNGEVIESFNNLGEYNDFLSDLSVEAWDSRDEIDSDELFNFVTWYVVIDNNGDFMSLTGEQFKAQA